MSERLGVAVVEVVNEIFDVVSTTLVSWREVLVIGDAMLIIFQAAILRTFRAEKENDCRYPNSDFRGYFTSACQGGVWHWFLTHIGTIMQQHWSERASRLYGDG